jgi:Tfp pilus assembly protein PilO
VAVSSRDQSLVWLFGTVVVGVVGWFFWLSPTARALQASQASVQSLTTTRQQLQSRLAFLTQVAAERSDHADAERLLTLAAPISYDFPSLVASLDAIASGSGVTLSSIQPQVGPTSQATFPATVSLSGTFSAIRSFVAAVEANIRPYTVTTLNVASSSTALGSTVVSGSLTLAVPFVALAAPPGRPSAATTPAASSQGTP